MEKKFYKNYQYYAFYQRITHTTKIIINVFLDSARYINISEINVNGTATESEIDFLAIDKINEIESHC